jgi:tetratricopeptide (TPR) repeat protein
MDGEQNALYRTIIQERYFKGRTATAVQDEVNLSKAPYHARQKQAVARFEPIVLAALNPAIRLESPLQVAEPLVGRQPQIAACWQALLNKKTVTVNGPGGVGKTALGSVLARSWEPEKVLWFTVHPGINDHLHSFVFALAYFCHQHGSSSLWQELISRDGQVRAERLPEVLRFTLQQLAITPLLCIDEADLLVPASAGNHAQFVQFLIAMRGLVPMLLMGQKVSIDADYNEVLTGLAHLSVTALLKQHGILLAASEQQQLEEYTGGNPRLLHLCIALHQSGEPLAGLLAELTNAPSLHFLLERILQRLSELEISVLMDLAVFQNPAPVDEWQGDPKVNTALARLQSRHLIQQDEHGGVALLPAFRDVIMVELPADKVDQLHKKAATIFVRRGKYTLAAYHLSRTNQPEVAVWLWKEVQYQEINQGQAYTALTLFRSMTAMPLSQAAREQVQLFCAALENLTGSAAKAQADLRLLLWQTPLLQVEADELGGVIANNLSDFTTAELLFRRAITKAETVVEARLAQIHKGLGWMYWRENNLEHAQREVSLARYEVENLEGRIQFSHCAYASAIDHFKQALVSARSLQYNDGIAKTCNNLFNVYVILGQFEAAQQYYEQAAASYRRVGNAIAMDGMAINYAVFQNQAGNHQQAAHLLQNILAQKNADPTRLTPNIAALIYQGLAEAQLGLGNLDDAEAYVQQAIAQEEISILPDSYRTYGEIFLQRGQLDLAEQMIRQSLTLIEEHDRSNYYLAGYGWRALALVYAAQKNITFAQDAQVKAVEMFTQIKLSNEVEKTYKQVNLL